MTSLAPLMSSAKSDWRAPDVVLDLVRQVGDIALDPCTGLDNPVAASAYCVSPTDWDGDPAVVVDGLRADWLALSGGGLVYVNPPFGRGVDAWMLRCLATGATGGECIALVPARTDTKWHRFCAPPASRAVCFWAGRLTFVGAPGPAPFPSAIVYWGPRRHRFAEVFSSRGAIWT